jgi:polyisoprenoid-binding protein YceI
MKQKLRFLLPLFALAMTAAAQETWQIDTAHSSAQFAVKHMMVSTVRGHFGKITGTVKYDAKAPEKSSVEATVDVNTVDTREPKRDAHLRSADFFDVEKYPVMTFKSTSVKAAGAGKLKVTGDLTMHGVTKKVTFDVEGPSAAVPDGKGGYKSGASATARIKRSEFALTWNRILEAGGVSVSDEVDLTIDIQLNKTGEKKSS